jgi:hypothetical protein
MVGGHLGCEYDDTVLLTTRNHFFQIERVASCLGPSTVELTLPLNAAECLKLPFAPLAGNQVVLQDGVQLSAVHSTSRLRFICSSCPKFSPIHAASFDDSQRIIGWDLRYGYSSHPCPAIWPSSAQTTSGCPGRTSKQAGLRRCTFNMIQALLAIIVMVSITVCCSCIRFSSLHLYIIHDIRYDIIFQNMI